MSYISQSAENILRNNYLPDRNRNNFWILSIRIKEPKIIQQCLEAISSQQLMVKCNKVHVTIDHRDKNIFITNLQESRPIINQIRHIQDIGNKLIRLPTKPPTPYHIEDVAKSSLRYDCYDSIFQTMRKRKNLQHSVHHFYVIYYQQIQIYSDPEYM